MNLKNIEACNPQSVNINLAKTSTTQTRISRRRRLIWTIFISIVAILIVLGIIIPTTIVKNKIKDKPTTVTTTTPPTTTARTTPPSPPPTTTTKAPISLVSINGSVNGVYNTSVGGNSVASSPIGIDVGGYPKEESPAEACDGNTSTKYVSVGACLEDQIRCKCGDNTGFYLELQRNTSLVTGLQLCTGDDYPERDPITVALEGSNESGTDLTFGWSWALIYSGYSGLQINPGRTRCGILQSFNNSIAYQSYRFLVLRTRRVRHCVQYSELRLFDF